MKTETKKASAWGYELIILFLCTILITLFLFFIDEGYYDFRWMANPGNWLAFVIYVLLIFGSQLFFSIILLKKYKGLKNIILSFFGGTMSIIFIIFVTVYLIK